MLAILNATSAWRHLTICRAGSSATDRQSLRMLHDREEGEERLRERAAKSHHGDGPAHSARSHAFDRPCQPEALAERANEFLARNKRCI